MDSVADNEINDKPAPKPRRGGGRGGGGRSKDPLGPDSEIGSRLRELYAEVENEPIPMQLIELLEKLSEAEAKAGQ